MTDWIDITVPLSPETVTWPGDPAVVISRLSTIAESGSNMTAISLSAHAGTHMDAPLHYLDGAAGIDRMPLDAGIGPCSVVRLDAPDQILAQNFAPGSRILLRTPNSSRPRTGTRFDERYHHLTPAGARHLASQGIRLVGIDYLSIGAAGEEGDEVHRILLSAGIWIAENLDLHAVEPGDYELVCLPLRLAGADGAPARAAVRKPVRPA